VTSRALVNLVGPLGSGKTTLARMFISRHEGWRHLGIDDYRSTCGSEDAAWRRLGSDVASTSLVVLETSGTSRRLASVLSVRSRETVVTVSCAAPVPVLLRRIKARPPRAFRFAYPGLSQRDSVIWMSRNLRRMCPVPIDAEIDTTQTETAALSQLESIVERMIPYVR
jgi:predicted kinase